MQLIYHIKAHNAKINSIKFIPSSKNFVSASDDKTIKVWKTFTYCLIFCVEFDASISKIKFMNKNKSILYISGNKSVGRLELVSRLASNLKSFENDIKCFVCSEK